jgi:hypothetical protein
VAGVTVEVVDGQILSCVSKLEGRAQGWATGTPAAWIRALTDHDGNSLEVGGNCRLARDLVHGLHLELFQGSLEQPRISPVNASFLP